MLPVGMAKAALSSNSCRQAKLLECSMASVVLWRLLPWNYRRRIRCSLGKSIRPWRQSPGHYSRGLTPFAEPLEVAIRPPLHYLLTITDSKMQPSIVIAIFFATLARSHSWVEKLTLEEDTGFDSLGFPRGNGTFFKICMAAGTNGCHEVLRNSTQFLELGDETMTYLRSPDGRDNELLDSDLICKPTQCYPELNSFQMPQNASLIL